MRVWSKNFTKGFGFKQEQCSYGQNTTYHCLHFNKQNADDENNPKRVVFKGDFTNENFINVTTTSLFR